MSGGLCRITSRSSGLLLPGVAGERDLAVVLAEELLQLAALAVGQRVHRVDDDRPHALARSLPQHAVDDRHDVGQRLARAGAGGQHVGLAAVRDLEGVDLMAVEGELPADRVLLGADPEDLARRRVQHTAVDQLGHGAAGLERRVEREPRLGPQQPVLDLRLDLLRGPGRPGCSGSR